VEVGATLTAMGSGVVVGAVIEVATDEQALVRKASMASNRQCFSMSYLCAALKPAASASAAVSKQTTLA